MSPFPFLSVLPILYFPIRPFPIIPYTFLSFPILSYPFIPFHFLCFPLLYFPFLSYFPIRSFLPYPILSYPFLSYPSLSFHFLCFPLYKTIVRKNTRTRGYIDNLWNQIRECTFALANIADYRKCRLIYPMCEIETVVYQTKTARANLLQIGVDMYFSRRTHLRARRNVGEVPTPFWSMRVKGALRARESRYRAKRDPIYRHDVAVLPTYMI